MTVPGSPTVRRRRLAAELREIRESTGKSGDAVAAALRWSPSKISRYERARTHDVVSAEHLRSGFSVEGDRDTYLHRIAFQMLVETAEKHWSGNQSAADEAIEILPFGEI
jgi:transcriptional regulator with XRE-family HTH domain